MSNLSKVEIGLENCEGIVINASDMISLRHNNVTNEIYLKIQDNGNIEYLTTWSNNKTSPIQRLAEYTDITSIDIYCEDGTKESIAPEWYFENEYCYTSSNIYQTNEVEDYKTLSINISKKKYIDNRINELNKIINDTKSEIDRLASL